jgi:hypothetical protein
VRPARLPNSLALAVAVWLVGGATTRAEAELVWLSSGRVMSVKSHQIAGDRITLALRDGGEVTCAKTTVVRIEPDEVERPEVEADSQDREGGAKTPDLQLTLAAPAPFGDLVKAAAERHGVDPNLVHAVIRAESNYAVRARSRRGARGLMQLMPTTLRTYQVRDAYDPQSNIEAGTKYLRALLDRFPLAEALAAYNAGAAAVVRYRGIPPFPETRSYVARVLGVLGTTAVPQR